MYSGAKPFSSDRNRYSLRVQEHLYNGRNLSLQLFKGAASCSEAFQIGTACEHQATLILPNAHVYDFRLHERCPAAISSLRRSHIMRIPKVKIVNPDFPC